jgi:hypothetical protein
MDPLSKKKQDNIAGYVISMWHLEDLLRAQRFDLTVIEELLVAPMEGDDRTRAEVRAWYADVVRRMRAQGITERGHLSEVEEVMNELEFLHRTLVEVLNDADYDAHFAKAEPDIKVLQDAAGEEADGPITTCFTAIYGVMVLRAKGQEVSAATTEAEGHFRQLLERLSQHYRQMRKLPGVSLN